MEAVRKTVYVQNRTPNRVLEKKNPGDAFLGEKPEVNHLRIFGCLVDVHIQKEKRSKLNPSGRKCIFVGYSDTSKAYQIYFSGFNKIDISRDVTFDEDSTYFKSKRTPTQEVEEPEETRVQEGFLLTGFP